MSSTYGSPWLSPTLLHVPRGGHLGVTVSEKAGASAGSSGADGHAPSSAATGLGSGQPSFVYVSDLNPNDSLAKAGMVLGSVIVSVAGKAVKSHAHAIELLEKANQQKPPAKNSTFEVVVREPAHATVVGNRTHQFV